MGGPVFHFDDTESLRSPGRATFLSEHELQTLIAQHPNLLTGDPEIEGGRFMVERQERAPGTAARWSADHLFLARDGVPTLVETRLVADAEAVGDLFGEVFYYAANAEAWWPIETLKAAFAATHGVAPVDADALLLTFLDDGQSPEAYWRDVVANLAAGRIRMMLIAQRIHPELARMTAFLGGQLRDAQVRLLEVRQQVGPSGRLLQLAVVASSAAVGSGIEITLPPPPSSPSEDPPEVRPAAAINSRRDAWVRAVRARCDADEAAAFDDLLRWMGEQYGATYVADLPTPTFLLAVKEAGEDRIPFGLTDTRMAAIQLGALAVSPAFEGEIARQAVIQEVIAAGLDIAAADVDDHLHLPLKSLADPRRRTRLLAVLDGIIESLSLKDALNAFPARH